MEGFGGGDGAMVVERKVAAAAAGLKSDCDWKGTASFCFTLSAFICCSALGDWVDARRNVDSPSCRRGSGVFGSALLDMAGLEMRRKAKWYLIEGRTATTSSALPSYGAHQIEYIAGLVEDHS